MMLCHRKNRWIDPTIPEVRIDDPFPHFGVRIRRGSVDNLIDNNTLALANSAR
jgi:hypothetical protein